MDTSEPAALDTTAPTVPLPNPTSRRGCSGDLRSVVDATGRVLEECPGGLGCLEGTCVEACRAAEGARGTLGCDFRAATPVAWYVPFFAGQTEIANQSCYAAMIVNGWSEKMRIGVDRAGASYDVTSFARIPNGDADPSTWPSVPKEGLAVGEVAILFLSHDPTTPNNPSAFHVKCPVPPAIAAPTGLHTIESSVTGRTPSFHITTSVPANAYDIYPFGGASSYVPGASLLLPTSAWGTSYVTPSVALPAGAVRQLGTNGGPNNVLQVTAKEDATTVTVLPSAPLPGGASVEARPAGSAGSFVLRAGETIQWNDVGDITGSIFASDKPVGVTTGNNAFFTTVAGDADAAHHPLFPVTSLGHEYVAAPLGRGAAADLGQVLVVMAVVDGTKVEVSGPKLTGYPMTFQMSAGTSRLLAESAAALVGFRDGVVVRSQDAAHPIFVGQYLPGCDVEAVDCGGPDFVGMIPTAQFLSRYVFYTDVTYPTTSLALVRRSVGGSFATVRVDCLGEIEESAWKDVATGSGLQTAVVDLRRRNQDVGACRDGAHVATSAAPFGVTVWGLARSASYGYAAGGNVARINDVEVTTVR